MWCVWGEGGRGGINLVAHKQVVPQTGVVWVCGVCLCVVQRVRVRLTQGRCSLVGDLKGMCFVRVSQTPANRQCSSPQNASCSQPQTVNSDVPAGCAGPCR